MRVCVQLFAIARQCAGCDSIDVDLPDGATVAQLRQELGARVPELAGLVGQMLFAADAEFVGDATPIRPGAEIACIPPVSGG